MALGQLNGQIKADAAQVAQLADTWVVQLSAKQLGTEWKGVSYTYAEIMRDHEQLRASLDALLVDGGTYNFSISGEPMRGWYITILPRPFATSDAALRWCRDSGLSKDDCAAKLISEDRSLTGTFKIDT